MKLIVKVKDIPIGCTITKPNGKKYLVQQKITIQHEKGVKESIHAEKDCVFLISGNQLIAVDRNKEIAIEVKMSNEDLLFLLRKEHKNEINS